MKYLLLGLIKLYWALVPPNKRRKCIFKKTCSHQVYDTTKEKGLKVGLKELKFRMNNCQPQFILFKDPITDKLKMILKTRVIIEENEIAERLK